MKAEYDLSTIKSRNNPYAEKLKKSVTIRLSEKELQQREAKRNIGDELLQAIRDVKSGNIGATYEVMPNEIVSGVVSENGK